MKHKKHNPIGPGRTLPSALTLGQTFLHPAFDYFFIGGALSLVVVALVAMRPELVPFTDPEDFRNLILFSNSAHFASSTVRLYSKPRGTERQPFLFVKVLLPLLAFAVVALCMYRADSLGAQLRSLYFTWSPYHYAAQSYGLTVMYCYRSGCLLNKTNKRLLWWTAMLPFFHNFLLFPKAGIHWIDFAGVLDHPLAVRVIGMLVQALPYVAFTAILLLFYKIWRSEARPMPMIGALILTTNGVWWFIAPPMQAFVWATIFHGVQYLAIVIIFHVKDQMNRPGNRFGATFHTLTFYGASLFLGYALFEWYPRGFMALGFGAATSVMLTVAGINLHHFIVDSFIWRLKKTDNNRGIVDTKPPAIA